MRVLDAVEIELLERGAERPICDALHPAGDHRLEDARLPFLAAGDAEVDRRVALILDLHDSGDRCERLEVLRRRRTEEARLECGRVGAPGKVAYGAVDQELSMVQERDVVADLLDLAEQMGAHENRAALAFQRLDYIADFGHASRVQARCGLVEEEEFRLVEQRLRDCDALFHPLRELLYSFVTP